MGPLGGRAADAHSGRPELRPAGVGGFDARAGGAERGGAVAIGRGDTPRGRPGAMVSAAAVGGLSAPALKPS